MSMILVVSANASGGRALRLALEDAGYAARTAADDEEALEAVRAGRPRLIVLDLAGADGREDSGTATGIRRQDAPAGRALLRRLCHDAGAPVVVLGGPEAPGEVVAALDDGAADYLAEPYRAAEVVARVRAILRRVGRAGGPPHPQPPHPEPRPGRPTSALEDSRSGERVGLSEGQHAS